MNNNDQDFQRTPFFQKTVLVVLGTFLAVLIIEMMMRLGGAALLSMQEFRNRAAISKKGVYTIMCLGESTTANQYPRFLEEELNKSGIGINFKVIDKGAWVATTDYILRRLEFNLDTYHPDLVITMMGINDDISHAPFKSIMNSGDLNFFESLRVYKLFRLLWQDIAILLKSRPKANPALLQQQNQPDPMCAKSQEVSGWRQAIERDSQDIKAHKSLGDAYFCQDRLQEAGEAYMNAIRIRPGDVDARIRLGETYFKQRSLQEAEDQCRKAVELAPENPLAQRCLAEASLKGKKLLEILEIFQKLIELSPKDPDLYTKLGDVYWFLNRPQDALEAYNRSFDFGSRHPNKYIRVAEYFVNEGKFLDAVEVYKKALGLDPTHDVIIYNKLVETYLKQGDRQMAKVYAIKAEALMSSFLVATIENYHKLKSALDARKIKYVCVQYPIRNVAMMKEIFKGSSEDIIFVDNEAVFKEAIQESGYWNIFLDKFAEDFGHCTEKGNRLLAQNIARTLVREVFKK